MFISQQAVSHNIRELEKRLGGSLFERYPGGVTPTPLGQALIDDARSLLASCSAFEEKAALMTLRRAGLSLAYADGIFNVEDAADLRALAAYVKNDLKTPLTLLERTTGECLAMLERGEADFLCLFNPPKLGGMRVEVLRAYPLFVGMSPGHPLSQKDVLTPEDFRQYPLIRDQRDDALNAMMLSFSSMDGVTPRLYAPSAQLSSFADILRRDNSLLMFTLPFLHTYAGADAVIRPFAAPGAPLRLCAVYPKGHPESARLSKIAAWLKRQYP